MHMGQSGCMSIVYQSSADCMDAAAIQHGVTRARQWLTVEKPFAGIIGQSLSHSFEPGTGYSQLVLVI